MRKSMSAWIFAALVCVDGHTCFGQWTKTIECPADRVYRDIREDGGRQEFCEHILPGSIAVRDGPYRFWFNRDVQGGAGVYTEGRKTGKWKECDSSGRCKQEDYPAIYPEEKQRPGFRPEVPVSYVNGRYVLDFASCRTTRIAHMAYGEADFDLGFTANPRKASYREGAECVFGLSVDRGGSGPGLYGRVR